MRQVYKLTSIVTLFAVAIPALIFTIPFTVFGSNYVRLFAIAIVPATLIPLLITPPLAFIVLNLFRVQTTTIDKVDHYVRFDTLTGVLTRAYLLGKTRDALPAGGAFLMIDADHFKSINDTHGHDIGDEALKRIAEVLRKAFSTEALVGRLGGEEFGVFLPGADAAQTNNSADRLCRLMREEGKIIAGKMLNLTVSIGCALHQGHRSLEETIKLADTALYHAKHNGRDRYCIADSHA